MTTSSPDADSVTKKSTESSHDEHDWTGREPLEFCLGLPLACRPYWLARRLEVYRESVVTYSSVLTSVRGGKSTVAEAEAQAAIATEGLTKTIPLEAPLYPLLLENTNG